MSAYAEYVSERRQVDALIADGYAITGAGEDLDGMHLYFTKVTEETVEENELLQVPAESRATVHTAKLLLLNPDARKYVSMLVFDAQRKAEGS
ncbi:hypothetical protein [Cohnella yongneupensis]|uniref:Uncharacterized protein n=1 Tax=Cohnella yongneupensis TaxID=425006 RepID=A0ABW0R3U7_9BACL